MARKPPLFVSPVDIPLSSWTKCSVPVIEGRSINAHSAILVTETTGNVNTQEKNRVLLSVSCGLIDDVNVGFSLLQQ